MENQNKAGSIILGLAATFVVGGLASQTAVKWDEANQSSTTTTQTTKGLYASATVMYALSALVLLVGTIITLARKV
jgi:hypothetical protein